MKFGTTEAGPRREVMITTILKAPFREALVRDWRDGESMRSLARRHGLHLLLVEQVVREAVWMTQRAK